MAFLKYARASLIKPAISFAGWGEVRAKAVTSGVPMFRSASQVLNDKFNPDSHMLSHCTIVASVDTEDTKLPVGRQVVNGMEIDRRFSDFFVTPDTSHLINNNQDAFERRLLLATFRTFIGGANYVEHLQIPELSKGRIIDAAARDVAIGPKASSIYIDILVATDLKHKALIAAIKSGQLQTLSMGAQVLYTQCTKCGNVAEDETQLCRCIRYAKGQTFVDGLGRQRRIAELCGHHTDPKSNKFIEASWVANPAFKGAVLRNILTPSDVKALSNRIQVAFSQPIPVSDPTALVKAARYVGIPHGGQVIPHDFVVKTRGPLPMDFERKIQDKAAIFGAPRFSRPSRMAEDFGFDDGAPAATEPEQNPLEKAVTDLADHLKEKAIERVRQDIADKPVPRADLNENQNDTLVKEATKDLVWKKISKLVMAKTGNAEVARQILFGLMLHRRGGWKAVHASQKFSGQQILAISRILDLLCNTSRVAGETRLYRTVVTVGGVAPYGDTESYLAACRRIVGRELTGTEKDALIAKGRLFDLGKS